MVMHSCILHCVHGSAQARDGQKDKCRFLPRYMGAGMSQLEGHCGPVTACFPAKDARGQRGRDRRALRRKNKAALLACQQERRRCMADGGHERNNRAEKRKWR